MSNIYTWHKLVTSMLLMSLTTGMEKLDITIEFTWMKNSWLVIIRHNTGLLFCLRQWTKTDRLSLAAWILLVFHPLWVCKTSMTAVITGFSPLNLNDKLILCYILLCQVWKINLVKDTGLNIIPISTCSINVLRVIIYRN
jgi:hypothetical protein